MFTSAKVISAAAAFSTASSSVISSSVSDIGIGIGSEFDSVSAVASSDSCVSNCVWIGGGGGGGIPICSTELGELSTRVVSLRLVVVIGVVGL